jgi:hypothetical protein
MLWDWDILTGQGDVFVYPVKSSLYHKSKIALASRSIMKALHPLLFYVALFGVVLIFFAKKKYQDIVPFVLYAVLVYVSAVYVVLQSEARYAIPLRPEMYLCAMFSLSIIVSKIKNLRAKSLQQMDGNTGAFPFSRSSYHN